MYQNFSKLELSALSQKTLPRLSLSYKPPTHYLMELEHYLVTPAVAVLGYDDVGQLCHVEELHLGICLVGCHYPVDEVPH